MLRQRFVLPNIAALPPVHREEAYALLRAPDLTPDHLLCYGETLRLLSKALLYLFQSRVEEWRAHYESSGSSSKLPGELDTELLASARALRLLADFVTDCANQIGASTP